METSRYVMLAGVAAGLSVAAGKAEALSEKVIYTGRIPQSQLVPDGSGALYGTGSTGSSAYCLSAQTRTTDFYSRCGAIVKLTPPSVQAPTWTEEAIYQFKGEKNHDGGFPAGRLTFDRTTGIFYETTTQGRKYCSQISGSIISTFSQLIMPCGTIYKLTPPSQKYPIWSENVIHYFEQGNGAFPNGHLIEDKSGNLFGSFTQFGSTKLGTGGVFELSPPPAGKTAWRYQVLYTFADSDIPSDINVDANGRIFGTITNEYLTHPSFAFMLTPPSSGRGKWTETVLHSFTGGADDGIGVNGGFIILRDGTLVGTAYSGGGTRCGTWGCGVVYELTPAGAAPWPESILYRFRGGTDGFGPQASMVSDSTQITLYGTTARGGKGYGTVFKLVKPASGSAWTETILHRFAADGKDGIYPTTPPHRDPATGILYGVTSGGGTEKAGTAFAITP
jgi:hypothetical protein